MTALRSFSRRSAFFVCASLFGCAPTGTVVRNQDELIETHLVTGPGEGQFFSAKVRNVDAERAEVILTQRQSCLVHDERTVDRTALTERHVSVPALLFFFLGGAALGGYGAGVLVDAPNVPPPGSRLIQNLVGQTGAYAIGIGSAAVGVGLLAMGIGTWLLAVDSRENVGRVVEPITGSTRELACNEAPVADRTIALRVGTLPPVPLGQTAARGKLIFSWRLLEPTLRAQSGPAEGDLVLLPQGSSQVRVPAPNAPPDAASATPPAPESPTAAETAPRAAPSEPDSAPVAAPPTLSQAASVAPESGLKALVTATAPLVNTVGNPPAPSKKTIQALVSRFAKLQRPDQDEYLKMLRSVFFSGDTQPPYSKADDNYGTPYDKAYDGSSLLPLDNVAVYWLKLLQSKYRGYERGTAAKVARIASRVRCESGSDEFTQGHNESAAKEAYSKMAEFSGSVSDYALLMQALKVTEKCRCSWRGCASVSLY